MDRTVTLNFVRTTKNKVLYQELETDEPSVFGGVYISQSAFNGLIGYPRTIALTLNTMPKAAD